MLEEEAKELEKVVIKLHMQAEIKKGTIKDKTTWEVSGHGLSKVHPSLSLSTFVILFSLLLMYKASLRLHS